MIGLHFTAMTPAKLRTMVIAASKRKNPVRVAALALESAGLHYGSADLADWLDALPGIDWHTWNGVLTIHFEENE